MQDHMILSGAVIGTLFLPLDPDLFVQAWFPFLILVELAIIMLCRTLKTPAATAVGAISYILSIMHGIGWAEWVSGADFDYSSTVRALEYWQLGALILLSPPTLAIADRGMECLKRK